MKTFYKQPSEVVDYDIDMTDYFADLDDDQISTAGGAVTVAVDNVTVPPLEIGPGLMAEFETVGDPRHALKVWVGGGLDGSKYKVTVVITTDIGRVEEVEFNVKVKET